MRDSMDPISVAIKDEACGGPKANAACAARQPFLGPGRLPTSVLTMSLHTATLPVSVAGDRQLNIQHRPISASGVTAALASELP
jgi:hypothetical protein